MMDFQNNQNDQEWNVWAKYVLLSLDKLYKELEDMKQKAQTKNDEFLVFKTKVETRSAMIAALVSVVTGIAVAIIASLIGGE